MYDICETNDRFHEVMNSANEIETSFSGAEKSNPRKALTMKAHSFAQSLKSFHTTKKVIRG